METRSDTVDPATLTNGVRYRRTAVPVDGGELAVGVWEPAEASGPAGGAGPTGGAGSVPQPPLVVAVHGITSSHFTWGLVGPRLGTDHRFVAVDLRGRGASRTLPGPYGMAAHAADVAAVIEAYGPDPAIVVGHSMGGFVAVELARRCPGLVRRLVLVDGGAPLPVPPGVDPHADEATIADMVTATVGAAFARLSMTFPDRESYRRFWRQHPSLTEWSEAVAAYVDYDLVGEEPALRPACLLEAAVRDARDLYAFAGVTPGPLPVPAVFLRAARGMLDEPDRPFYPEGYAATWLTGVPEITVDGVNHYTITLGPAGADAVEQAVRA